MTKTLFCLAVLTAALVSCQKNEVPASEEVQKIPVTLTASFAGEPGTKVSVTPEGRVLKSTWDANETISVVTLSSIEDGARLVAVNNFTSSGAAGRTDAEFTGKFTGGDNPARVIVIYPALRDPSRTYETAPYIAADGTQKSILSGARQNDRFFENSDISVLKQTADNNCDHFKNFCVMTGNVDVADLKEGKLSVKLRNLMSVLRIVAKFDSSSEEIGTLTISAFSHGEPKKMFNGRGNTHLDLDYWNIRFVQYTDQDDHVSLVCPFKPHPQDHTATLYIPIAYMSANEQNEWWRFETSTGLTSTKVFENGGATYEAGKVYTVNVDFISGIFDPLSGGNIDP